MSDEKKIDLEELEGVLGKEEESSFNFQTLFAMFVLNWQWFVLSMFICICGALIYLRYATPVYQVSTKMLIKDEQNPRRNSNQMLANMTDLGFMTNSAGIDNEVEILQSHILACEAVKNLKLYTTYHLEGRIKDAMLYLDQPITVELDSAHLSWFDEESLDVAHMVSMVITKSESAYDFQITCTENGKVSEELEKSFKTLPAKVETSCGTLTFKLNENVKTTDGTMQKFESGRKLYVAIVPPMAVARSYVKSITVEPTSKMTSIAQITIKDQNPRRAIDFINELAEVYNEQANIDKNEIAMKTEEFINGRLEKIDAELGSTEDNLENFKRRNKVTQLNLDASQTLTQTNQYAAKLAEANSQLQLIDYLREFVDNPDHRYEIIPSNVGLTDQASTALITQYNQRALDRNRLLKSVSEQAPQVVTLSGTLDEMRNSIRTALLQARRSADILRQGIERQYNIYNSRVTSTPEQERVLTQIGRQQEVKSGLYLMLLQKREENSISLAATADKGKLIDVAQYEGKVSPKKSIIMLAALVIGLFLPMAVLYLLQIMSYKIEGHDDLARLTKLPIIADVAVASDKAKDSAGIVVHENKNDQIDEIFRSMRTNIQFMLQGDEKVILFTSSTSGEGKTFNAANIAVSFALLGKKAVLCGMDIRKPSLGRLFGISDRERGLTPLLTRANLTEQDVKGQIIPSGVNSNLELLLAGPTPPNPTELLARENLKTVIDVLRKEYDYVILDTAPVGLVTDTLQISKYADVNVYVTRADYTPKANIALLNTLNEEKKLKNTCIVLNGVDMSKKKYGYYYGYGRYGKYGRYGYNSYGKYGYGNYGNYGNYAASHYGNKDDDSIKR